MSTKHSKNSKNNAVNIPQSGEVKTPVWSDPKTGLEWQHECAGTMSWSDAIEYAQSLSLNGKDDWRLPAVMELETLLNRGALYDSLRPAMRKDVPFRDKLSYWSSTTFEENTNSAWIIKFDGGYILSYYKSNHYNVRCVRG